MNSKQLSRRWTWNPWGDLMSLQEEVNRLFESYPSQVVRRGLFGTSYMPPVDVLRDKEQVVVKIDLPGMRKEDLDITVLNDSLFVRGTKKAEEEGDKDAMRTRERFFGSFERVIDLPNPVDPDRIAASFAEGVLTVTCPIRESAKPRQIAVEVK